jgi:hypothetical protein
MVSDAGPDCPALFEGFTVPSPYTPEYTHPVVGKLNLSVFGFVIKKYALSALNAITHPP